MSYCFSTFLLNILHVSSICLWFNFIWCNFMIWKKWLQGMLTEFWALYTTKHNAQPFPVSVSSTIKITVNFIFQLHKIAAYKKWLFLNLKLVVVLYTINVCITIFLFILKDMYSYTHMYPNTHKYTHHDCMHIQTPGHIEFLTLHRHDTWAFVLELHFYFKWILLQDL